MTKIQIEADLNDILSDAQMSDILDCLETRDVVEELDADEVVEWLDWTSINDTDPIAEGLGKSFNMDDVQAFVTKLIQSATGCDEDLAAAAAKGVIAEAQKPPA